MYKSAFIQLELTTIIIYWLFSSISLW